MLKLNTETSGAGYANTRAEFATALGRLFGTPGEALLARRCDERFTKQADDAYQRAVELRGPSGGSGKWSDTWRDGSGASPTACRNCAARPKGALMRP